jgi:hypothetical protein
MALDPHAAQHIARRSRIARQTRVPEVTPQQQKDHEKIAKAIMYARKLKQDGAT